MQNEGLLFSTGQMKLLELLLEGGVRFVVQGPTAVKAHVQASGLDPKKISRPKAIAEWKTVDLAIDSQLDNLRRLIQVLAANQDHIRLHTTANYKLSEDSDLNKKPEHIPESIEELSGLLQISHNSDSGTAPPRLVAIGHSGRHNLVYPKKPGGISRAQMNARVDAAFELALALGHALAGKEASARRPVTPGVPSGQQGKPASPEGRGPGPDRPRP